MWEIVGFETSFDESGSVKSYTFYCQKPVDPKDGFEGLKCKREWYRADQVQYVPQIGDHVIIEKEDYGKFQVITNIYVM